MTEFHGDYEALSEEDKDLIINPKHYEIIPPGNYPDGVEYIRIAEYAIGHLKGIEAHLVGQILKYSLRIGKKDSMLQDADKIKWYANHLSQILNEKSDNKGE